MPPVDLGEQSTSAEDLRGVDFERLLSRATSRDCSAYAVVLRQQLSETVKNTQAWRGLALVAFAVCLSLDAHDHEEPLKASAWFAELTPRLLTAPQLKALEEWLPEVNDPELAARIADVLWLALGRSGHSFGRLAARHYVDSGLRLVSASGGWRLALDRFRRGHILGAKFGLRTMVPELLESLVDDQSGSTQGIRDVHFVSFLFEQGAISSPRKYVAWAESRAARFEAEAASEFYGSIALVCAREYWELAARLRDSSDKADREPGRAARLRAAETYVLDADKARDANQPLVEARFLSDAVVRMRRIGVPRQRTDELLLRLRDAQDRAPLEDFSYTVDATQEFRRGHDAVRDQDLSSALIRLAFVVKLPRVAELRSLAEDYLQRSIATRIASTTLTSSDNRVLAHLPTRSDEQGENEALLNWHMWSLSGEIRLRALGYIHGAREQLLLDHRPARSVCIELASSSWLVPAGHEHAFARGLHLGLYGDTLSAAHILVPQLENALREFVERGLGKPLLQVQDDGTQRVGLMDRILRVPALAQVLGPDLIFVLQGLLVRQEADNFRNNIAHGLVPDGGYQSPGAYLWWLCFRLCCMPLPLKAITAIRAAATDDNMPGESTPE